MREGKKSSTIVSTISVIIPTFNSSKTIENCLKSVRKQNYPQDKIEIIIVDGGSKDNTLDIIKEFKVKVFKTDPNKQNVEYNKSIGIKNSTGKYLFMLDHDNILSHKNLLNKMMKPFSEVKDLVGVETMRYHYDRKATLLDRYIALFGVNDPLAFYIGKADRMSFIYKEYARKYNPEDRGDYYLVKFTRKNLPTVGANGFLVKKDLLVENANIKPGKYFPIDVNMDLVRKGIRTYAFVKDGITHLSGHGSVVYYLKRRMLFMQQYYLSQKNLSMMKDRRYSLYEKKDFWRLLYFIVISVTFVVPLIDSLRGYAKKRDVAWFIHPLMCFGFVIMYGYVILEHKILLMLGYK